MATVPVVGYRPATRWLGAATTRAKLSAPGALKRMGEFPADGMALTVLLVVSDLADSIRFYRDVLGASLYREYGGTSAVFTFAGTWILLVTGGGPTKDKPDVTFASPADRKVVD